VRLSFTFYHVSQVFPLPPFPVSGLETPSFYISVRFCLAFSFHLRSVVYSWLGIYSSLFLSPRSVPSRTPPGGIREADDVAAPPLLLLVCTGSKKASSLFSFLQVNVQFNPGRLLKGTPFFSSSVQRVVFRGRRFSFLFFCWRCGR